SPDIVINREYNRTLEFFYPPQRRSEVAPDDSATGTSQPPTTGDDALILGLEHLEGRCRAQVVRGKMSSTPAGEKSPSSIAKTPLVEDALLLPATSPVLAASTTEEENYLGGAAPDEDSPLPLSVVMTSESPTARCRVNV
ncbi:unnamed protein product, partial [Amoebophrya sp. A25]